jgi:hypothetical protein
MSMSAVDGGRPHDRVSIVAAKPGDFPGYRRTNADPGDDTPT